MITGSVAWMSLCTSPVTSARHSHASLLIELGVSVLYISERLGHENIETTLEIYAHLYPHKNVQIMEQLNALCA